MRRRAPRTCQNLLAMGVALLCVSLAGGEACAAPASGKSVASALRGETIARRYCADCHGMGLTEDSAWQGAPAFRDIRIDNNAISYARRLEQLHQGHVKMPPAGVSLDELRDIDAYSRSLRRAKTPSPR